LAEDWLATFETALVSRDVTLLGALFHKDCHWRDILAFTWHLTSTEGRNNIAMRLAAEQGRVAAHGFHLPPGRKPPRKVKRLGIDSVEAIFEFNTADGRGAGKACGSSPVVWPSVASTRSIWHCRSKPWNWGNLGRFRQVDLGACAPPYRNVAKKARTSPTKSSGCSKAAK
jgi:hypothetical protein